MQQDVRVRVDGVAKKFCRDLKRSLWYALEDMAADLVRYDRVSSLRTGEFWALDEVSLELERGECLGLIGRNGAGKTTLLKMLAGLVKPDKGRIEIRGRVGALISLGAGFNPILTGRENVYVNGSVLGLTKKEIDERFDAIVDFAELHDVIDTPVQSYSSGMHVRLGFAVATALRPDLLLLDEVLAVGDAAFRAKCYDRLASLRETAAFVLVSHDMDQIARVCSRVLLLDRGRAHFLGDVACGIQLYHELSQPSVSMFAHEHVADRVMASLDWCDDTVALDGLFHVALSVRLPEPVAAADLRVVMWGDDGLPALDAYSRTQDCCVGLEQGTSVITFTIGPLRLKRGRYAVSIALLNRATNLHLYWGDRVRTVDVHGPVSGAVPYTPALGSLTVSHAGGEATRQGVAPGRVTS
jgi:homopolymeric O-antigen transport system ATP-binding protein